MSTVDEQARGPRDEPDDTGADPTAEHDQDTVVEDDEPTEPATAPLSGPDEATRLSTAPDPRAARRVTGHGAVATARRWWRQLTSMRTALMLLFLLAVAAVPGSLLPQRNLNIENVNAYFAEHPKLAPILDRLSFFDVYASPWFAAIYLLLFISLVGCLTPRMRLHLRALRKPPPDAPRHLHRLPHHVDLGELAAAPDALAARTRDVLRRRRWRTTVREHAGGVTTVSAEKGYLREAGNLVFHFSLLALLVAVALGAMFGWRANRILVQGPDAAYCNTLQQYDEYDLGSRVEPTDLPPFCVELTDFTARFLDTGQPVQFTADVRYTVGTDGTPTRQQVEVNSPLRLDGATVNLLGHGYAPVVRYTDRHGNAQTSSQPFLTTEGQNLTSEGVAVFPDANVDPATGQRDPNQQIAFEGIFLPTIPDSPPFVRSAFPALRKPGLLLFGYQGDIGLDAGIPRSVYSLDRRQIETGRLKQIGTMPKLIEPGEIWRLDDGTVVDAAACTGECRRNTVEFVGVKNWVTVAARHDPGQPLLLGGAALLLAGLVGSLSVRRRRVWFRIESSTSGSRVSAGGLARTEYASFPDELQRLVAAVQRRTGQPDSEPADSDSSDSDAPDSEERTAPPPRRRRS